MAYPQYYPQQMQQPYMQQPVQQVQQTPMQIQNGGFISVPSEDIVRTYPVAPGNCVTFKIEGQPIVMEKSMGFSQLEAPKIERYKLVKEMPIEAPNSFQNDQKQPEPINTTIDEIKSEIDMLRNEIEAIKKKLAPKTSTKKKEVTEDDE